ncbi:MAG: HlyD family efflux transporter periplasmic adaptor subunit [Sutterellaceae bacterium]|nr:HlyD family efflux transporter periplasmic adaptor subunit [Sutterellaceae bacterium]MDD7442283.1 HlyD family efflux transporter periplasmic adaptor subunit [Sutterellaceae bacterium]MDY2867755.1 HlyD family efflux transporter periplasmic adaptor subunit [Mesosutterella sp.]
MAEERKQEQAEGNTARAPAREAKPGRASFGKAKKLARPLVFFGALLVIGTALIMLGGRHDADTLARTMKYGILTADEVNTAFERVSGKLVSRPAVEGKRVKAGDVLMELDPTDNAIAIRKTRAAIENNRAAVEEEKRQIEIDLVASGTTERNAWRRIEGLQAALDTARSNERRAAADFARAKALIASHAISQSSYDQLKSAWETAAASVTSARRALDAATVGATRADLSRLSSKGTADGMRLSEIADTRASIRNRTLKVAQLEAEGRSLEADLDALEVEKNRLTLRAPEDGKVLKLMYEPGEIVPAGTPAVLLQTDRSYYEIYVSERDAARFSEGKDVVGTTASGDKVKGTVRVLRRAPAFADIRGSRERGQADLASLIARIYIVPRPGVVPGMTIGVKTDD